MNKYDKEDTVGAGTFALVLLLSFVVGVLALIGFITVVTWIFEKIS